MESRKIVFDLESNGLLYDATTIHCIVCKDISTNQVHKFTPLETKEGLDFLKNSSIIIGHNISTFDIPLIYLLHNINLFDYCQVRDTYTMSRLFYPEQQAHSLGYYGSKFGREKPVHEDWSVFSEDMLHRCSEDVEINHLTYNYLVEKNCSDGWNWLEALKLEQLFGFWQGLQEKEGVDIDVALCHELVARLDKEIEEIDNKIQPDLPFSVVPVGQPVLKPFKKDGSLCQRVQEFLTCT